MLINYYLKRCLFIKPIRRPHPWRGTKLRDILHIPVSLYSPCCLLQSCLYMLVAAMLSDWFSANQKPDDYHPCSPDSDFWSTPAWPWKIIKCQSCLQGTQNRSETEKNTIQKRNVKKTMEK